jgi:hypothetical protein
MHTRVALRVSPLAAFAAWLHLSRDAAASASSPAPPQQQPVAQGLTHFPFVLYAPGGPGTRVTAAAAEAELVARVPPGSRILVLEEPAADDPSPTPHFLRCTPAPSPPDVSPSSLPRRLFGQRGGGGVEVCRAPIAATRAQSGDVELHTDRHLLTTPLASYVYGRLLLLPAPNPITLSAGSIDPNAIPFVRVALPDPVSPGRVAREILEGGSRHVTVAGGGWSALRAVNALLPSPSPSPSSAHCRPGVSIVTQEPTLLSEILPRYLCDALHRRLRSSGVDVVPYSIIHFIGHPPPQNTQTGTTGEGRAPARPAPAIEVHTSRTYDYLATSTVETDALLFAPQPHTIAPDVHFCAGSGSPPVRRTGINSLEVDAGGIVVNSELAASSDVYVAGAAASFPDPVLGRMRRDLFGCADNDARSAAHAAANMADPGLRARYSIVPVQRHELDRLGVAAVTLGRVSSRSEGYGFFLKAAQGSTPALHRGGGGGGGLSPHTLGVVFSVEAGSVVGALLWAMDAGPRGVRGASGLGAPSPSPSPSPPLSPIPVGLSTGVEAATALCRRLIVGTSREPLRGEKEDLAPLLAVAARGVALALAGAGGGGQERGQPLVVELTGELSPATREARIRRRLGGLGPGHGAPAGWKAGELRAPSAEGEMDGGGGEAEGHAMTGAPDLAASVVPAPVYSLSFTWSAPRTTQTKLTDLGVVPPWDGGRGEG